jgi:hypothetical protein
MTSAPEDGPKGMEELEPLIGDWSLEAAFSFPVPDDVEARTTFTWDLDRRFIVQRSSVSIPEAPDGLMVIAPAAEGTGYTQHYFDSRGVVRLYDMTFENGIWTLSRTKPDFSPLDFHQRYTGEFSEDGNTIDGRWEISHDAGATWELDFGLVYRRIS